MQEWFLAGFGNYQIWMLAVCAFMVGISKTGVPGLGILVVSMMAMSFPAKESTGLLLLLLGAADVFAVAYYRRHAHWALVLKLLPWALAGIGAGSIVLRYLDDKQLRPVIGFIILAMLAINYWRTRLPAKTVTIPHHWLFAAVMGFTAGLTTQISNAAGPVMAIYLLAMQLPKNEYIGTGAWYFLILNWLKIPLFALDGRITMSAVHADLAMIPLLALGAGVGILILHKIPQRWFEVMIQLLALAAALRLCCYVTDFF
ncbi:MAG: sulfite exporter TauE/SafE family protein [Victivallaceae bacterium]